MSLHAIRIACAVGLRNCHFLEIVDLQRRPLYHWPVQRLRVLTC